jgi:hypothetical protein
VCDPLLPDGGTCYGVPNYTSQETSFDLWVADAAASRGGYRISLALHTPVTVGGHTYEDRGEGLVGGGANGVFGDFYVAVDGHAQQIHFHFEGFAIYKGAGTWDWTAALTREDAASAACGPATIARHYTIKRTGPACPPAGSGVYTFVADDPPRACGVGVDLVHIVLPGA